MVRVAVLAKAAYNELPCCSWPSLADMHAVYASAPGSVRMVGVRMAEESSLDHVPSCFRLPHFDDRASVALLSELAGVVL